MRVTNFESRLFSRKKHNKLYSNFQLSAQGEIVIMEVIQRADNEQIHFYQTLKYCLFS